jgi:hypothetical protein
LEAEDKKRLNNLWKDRINELRRSGKDEDAAAIKVWLRARHAWSIGSNESGAQDFERITRNLAVTYLSRRGAVCPSANGEPMSISG